jgi:hypothetical protein
MRYVWPGCSVANEQRKDGKGDMRIELSVEDIQGLLQVGPTSDEKGNPVVALEILGSPVLYADPRDLPHRDYESWEEMVSMLLSRFFADLLLKTGSMEGWSKQSPTGREVSRLSSREDYSGA